MERLPEAGEAAAPAATAEAPELATTCCCCWAASAETTVVMTFVALRTLPQPRLLRLPAPAASASLLRAPDSFLEKPWLDLEAAAAASRASCFWASALRTMPCQKKKRV